MNSFTSTYRRCCWCDKLQNKGHFSVCSKCKAFAYCDKTCQASGWKSGHKKCCKAPTTVAPPLPSYLPSNLVMSETGGDMDFPYKFIAVHPVTSGTPTKEEWERSVRGVTDPSILATLEKVAPLTRTHEVSLSDNALISAAFGWKCMGDSPVPGFSSRFAGFSLRGLYEDCYQTRQDLGNNASAGYLYTQAPEKANGIFVFWCTADATGLAAMEAGQSPVEAAPSDPLGNSLESGVIVPITRRQILQTVEHHHLCSSSTYNTLPLCVHFENICRATGLAAFKKENFQMCNLDGSL